MAKTKHVFVSERDGQESNNASLSRPVDLVITWVNGSDPSFIETLERSDISENYTVNVYIKESSHFLLRCTVVTKVRFGPFKIKDCAERCKLSDLNNGICDKECNISNCDWDGEDCHIYGTDSRPRTGLKRFRSYLGSLYYVVFLYNKEFGYVHRKVPAHTPYIIDKTVMDELYNRFLKEWEKTSASKVRDQYNFQYPFAYYHYLLRPQLKERGETRKMPIATLYPGYKDLAYFETGNPTKLEKSLQRLLEEKYKKFACINDVMDHNNVKAVEMCQVVIEAFFKQLLPEPSSFELEE